MRGKIVQIPTQGLPSGTDVNQPSQPISTPPNTNINNNVRPGKIYIAPDGTRRRRRMNMEQQAIPPIPPIQMPSSTGLFDGGVYAPGLPGQDLPMMDQQPTRQELTYRMWDDNLTIPERLEAAMLASKSETGDYTAGRIPFSPFGAISGYYALRAMKRIEAGKGSGTDFYDVARYLERNGNTQQAKSFMRKVGDVVSQLPALGGELFMTGGAGTAVGAGVRKAVGKGITGKVAGAIGRVGTQAAMMPHRVAESSFNRQRSGESPSQANYKAFVDTFIEVGTELAGAKIIKLIPGGAQAKEAVKAMWIKVTGKTGEEATKVLNRFGYHGMLVEILEERMGEAARGVTIDPGDFGVMSGLADSKTRDQAIEQLAVEAVAFAIPGAAGALTGSTSPQTPSPSIDRVDDAPIKDNSKTVVESTEAESSTTPFFRIDKLREMDEADPAPTPEEVKTELKGKLDDAGVTLTENMSRKQVQNAFALAGIQIPKHKATELKRKYMDERAVEERKNIESKTGPMKPREVLKEKLNSELQPLTASQIRDKYGYKKGIPKQKMIARALRENVSIKTASTPAKPASATPASATPASATPAKPASATQAKTLVTNTKETTSSTTKKPLSPIKKGRTDKDVARAVGKLNAIRPGFSIVEPTKDYHRDAIAFAEARGLRAALVHNPDTTTRGMSHGKVVLLNTAISDEGDFWGVVGHEVSHGTGIDQLQEEWKGSEAIIEKAAQEYYDGAGKDIQRSIDNKPTKRFREGVARVIQKFMRDGKFRDQLANDNPTLFQKIRDKVLHSLRNFTPTGRAANKAIELLKRSKEDFESYKAEIRQRERAGALAEEGKADEKELARDYQRQVEELLGTRVGKRGSDKQKAARRKFTTEQKRKKIKKAITEKDNDAYRGYDEVLDRIRMDPGNYPDFSGLSESEVFEKLAYGRKFRTNEEIEDEADKIAESENEDWKESLKLDKAYRSAINTVKKADPHTFDEAVRQIKAGYEDSGFEIDDATAEKEAIDFMIDMSEKPAEVDPETPFDEDLSELDKQIRDRLSKMKGLEALAKTLNKLNLPTVQEINTLRFHGRANPATTIAGRREVFREDANRGRPKRRTREVAEKEADRQLKKDFIGEKHKFLRQIRLARNGVLKLTESETVKLRKIIDSISIASALQDPEALEELRVLNEGYRSTRSEQARALSLRDPITEMEPGKRRATIVKRALTDGITAEFLAKILDGLRKAGIDPARIDDLAEDEAIAIQIIRIIKQHNNTISDQIYEYWQNSILSGIATQVANISGNLTYTGLEFSTRVVEAFIVNPLQPKSLRSQGAQIGEFKHMLKGMWPAMTNAIVNAGKSFATEESALDLQVGAIEVSKIEGKRNSIKGTKGKIIRLPYRALGAMDNMFRTFSSFVDVGAQAYRIGKAKGLQGDALEKFISIQVGNYESLAWLRAMETGRQHTFQQEGGVINQKFKHFGQASKKIPGVRYFVPFINTPVNMFAAAQAYIPIVGVAHHLADKMLSGKAVKADADAIARQVVGALFTGIIYSLVGDDEENRLITGTRSMDQGKSSLDYRTAPPQSIKIGGIWRSYSRIEPFATMFSTMVDAIDNYNAEPGTEMKVPVINQVNDKLFLQGLGDLLELTQGKTSISETLSEPMIGFIPNIYRQTARAIDPGLQDSRIKKSDDNKTMLKKIGRKTQLPFNIEQIYKQDIWGRKITPNGPKTSLPAMLWRAASPVRAQKIDVVKPDLALARWNELNPEESYAPTLPAKSFQYNGKKISMSEKAYEEFVRRAGKQALIMASKRSYTTKPTADDIDFIRKQISAARSAVKKQMLSEGKF